jgi:hypothetical protein
MDMTMARTAVHVNVGSIMNSLIRRSISDVASALQPNTVPKGTG